MVETALVVSSLIMLLTLAATPIMVRIDLAYDKFCTWVFALSAMVAVGCVIAILAR